MNDNSKFYAGVLLGAAAGAALALFCNSDKGKEVACNLKSAVGKAGDKLKEKFNETIRKGKDFADDIADEAQKFSV